jgi:hypothetical protein
LAKSYSVFNNVSPTTGAPVKVTSATPGPKTMIQMSTSASSEARITEWWWEGDASAAATPVQVELMFVGSGAATVTAYVAGDIKKYDPNGRGSLMTLGTANSGYSASVEGTPAGGTQSMAHLVPPTSGIYIQYPLGREPEMAVSTFLRIRNSAPAAVNVQCGLAWEE